MEGMPEELKQMIVGAILGGDRNLSKKPVAKLTPEEIVRFEEINARTAALNKEVRVAKSKLDRAKQRLWSDMEDKYNLHDKNVTYDSKKGALFEVLPPDLRKEKENEAEEG